MLPQYTLSAAGFGIIMPGMPFTMPANIDDVTITLTAYDDTVVEATQDVTIQILSSSSYTVGTLSSAVIHILDNDSA